MIQFYSNIPKNYLFNLFQWLDRVSSHTKENMYTHSFNLMFVVNKKIISKLIKNNYCSSFKYVIKSESIIFDIDSVIKKTLIDNFKIDAKKYSFRQVHLEKRSKDELHSLNYYYLIYLPGNTNWTTDKDIIVSLISLENIIHNGCSPANRLSLYRLRSFLLPDSIIFCKFLLQKGIKC